MKKILSIVLTISCFMTVLFVPQGANAKTQFYESALSGWQFVVYSDAADKNPDVRFEIDKTVKAEGENSLKISYLQSETVGPSARANIWLNNLKKDKRYRLGYKIKAQNASSVAITLDSNPGFGWSNFTADYGTTFDWKSVELEFEYKKDQPMCRYVIEIRGLCEGLWFDDFYCYEYDGNEKIGNNLAQNPGIENLDSCTLNVIGAKTANDKPTLEPFDIKKLGVLTKKDDLKVDANLDDWNGISMYDIPTYYPIEQEAPQTIEGKFGFAYDDNYFYAGVTVEDDVYSYSTLSSEYYKNDSLQIAWADSSDVFHQAAVWAVDGALETIDLPEGASAAVNVNGTKTVYEVAVPWSAYFKQIPEKLKINVLVNDNDKDQYGRRGWLELTGGIGISKDASLFGSWYTNSNDFILGDISTGDGYCQVDSTSCFTEVKNIYDTEKTFEIKVNNNTPETIVIPGHCTYNFIFDADVTGVGYHDVTVKVTEKESGISKEKSTKLVRCPTDDEVKTYQRTFEGYRDELKKLVDDCEGQGLSIRYEKAIYTLVKIFTDRMSYDLGRGKYDQLAEYIVSIEEFYKDTKAKLVSYLNGEASPIEVPEVQYSNVHMKDDGHFYGWKETEDGLVETPVFLVGGNTYEIQVEDFYDLHDLGFNTMEIGVYETSYAHWEGTNAVPSKLVEGRIDPNAIHSPWEVREMLRIGKETNLTCDILFSTMGYNDMPDAFYDAVDKKNNTSVYLKFNITHPAVQLRRDAAFKMFFENVAKDYEDAIHMYDVSNEPSFLPYDKMYYREYWLEYLVDMFDNDINKLNERYGTNYEKFSDCEMPWIEYTPLYQDYRDFAENVMSTYLKNSVDTFKKYKPDGPVAIKQVIPVYIKEFYAPRIHSTNHEKQWNFFDYNGCDAGNDEVNGEGYIGFKDGSLENILLFYDYMYSCSPRAVSNSENHIISNKSDNGNVDYGDWNNAWVRANVWQGFIHNMQSTAVWGFATRLDKTPYYNSMFYNRPRQFAELGKVSLDAQRLANELIMFHDKKADAAMLYSDSTFTFSKDHFNALNVAHNTMLYNGLKPHCLVESQMEKLDDYDILIVPHSTHITREALEAIKKFADRGGTLIFYGDDCLAKDEYGKDHDPDLVKAIRDKAIVYDIEIENEVYLKLPDNYDDDMYKLFKKQGYINAEVIDKKTGKKAEKVMWDYVEKDGRQLINIINSDWYNTPEVDVYINGVKQNKMYDLLNCKAYNGESIKLDSFEPVLMEIGADGPEYDKGISVEINDKKVNFDVAPTMENDRVLVPMRKIFEELGATVEWDDATQTANAVLNDIDISVKIDSNILNKNNADIQLDVPARIKNDRTLVPIRAISEAFNCKVEWDDETKTVKIIK